MVDDWEFPKWVDARFPLERLTNCYRLVTTVSVDENYAVVRRVKTGKTVFVKYFRCAAEGYREAMIHKYMQGRYPEHVAAVVDSGPVEKKMAFEKTLPPPCLITDCPDIKYYIVTADVGEGFVSASSKHVVDREGVRSYVSTMLNLLLDMQVAAGFTHWDLHGNNFFYNSATKTFRILDFGLSTLVDNSTGEYIANNDIVVGRAALRDFGDNKKIFGFYYDVGRVLLHSSVVVREEVLSMYGTDRPDFSKRYKRIISGRIRTAADGTAEVKPPSRAVILEIEHYYVARFALEACAEYPWLLKRNDTIARGTGPPGKSRVPRVPFPRLLRLQPLWLDCATEGAKRRSSRRPTKRLKRD